MDGIYSLTFEVENFWKFYDMSRMTTFRECCCYQTGSVSEANNKQCNKPNATRT